jgi:hypothetical protein
MPLAIFFVNYKFIRFKFDPFKDVSFGRGCELQEHFFEKIWPSKLYEMQLLGKI